MLFQRHNTFNYDQNISEDIFDKKHLPYVLLLTSNDVHPTSSTILWCKFISDFAEGKVYSILNTVYDFSLNI